MYTKIKLKWELYQGLNVLGGWTQILKTDKTEVYVTHAIINILKIVHYIIERGLGVVGSFKYIYIDEETCTANWVVFCPSCDVY